MFKRLIKSILLKFSFQIRRVTPDKDTPVSFWDTDTKFNEIFSQISKHTVVDKIRCFMIYQYARQVFSLSGEVAEVGVYRGGSAKLLAKIFEPIDKVIHLFDTFTGMPPSDSCKDIYREGDFNKTTLEEVRDFLSDCKNVRLYPGFFPKSAPDCLMSEKFCLVHIDVDIYHSIKDCCEFFYPKLEKSAIMIFDDYGFPLCPGARLAVDEFFRDKQEKPLYLPTGQCIVIRQ